jgi:LETM1 and EF-hand domain-containing protein 1
MNDKHTFLCGFIFFPQEEEKKEQVEEKEKSTTVADESDEKDHALREMILATAREAQQLAQSKTLDKRDELCKLSGALAVLASASVSPFFCHLFGLWHILEEKPL